MEIGQIEKNGLNKIIVEVKEFKGCRFVDIRVHYLADDGKYKPSKKGIALSLENIDKALDLLTMASKKLKNK